MSGGDPSASHIHSGRPLPLSTLALSTLPTSHLLSQLTQVTAAGTEATPHCACQPDMLSGRDAPLADIN
jgi:hypothetical protein